MFSYQEKVNLITLFTHSRQDLLESLSDILKCSEGQIEESVSKIEVNRPEDISLSPFFRSIGLDTEHKNLLFNFVSFDSVIMSHLSSRISEPKNKPLFNLYETLTGETDLRSLFLKYGVSFELRDKRIVTYYRGAEVNWDNYSCYALPRVKKRLLLNNKHKDRCINGYLFNHQIWKDHRVKRLHDGPEILKDISTILGISGIIDEWERTAKLYCIGVRVKINTILFDEAKCYTFKSKIFHIYKQTLYYLKMSKNGIWSPNEDNPMIRLKDDLNLRQEDIIGYYEVDREDLYD
jgi:hypothetical protein